MAPYCSSPNGLRPLTHPFLATGSSFGLDHQALPLGSHKKVMTTMMMMMMMMMMMKASTYYALGTGLHVLPV